MGRRPNSQSCRAKTCRNDCKLAFRFKLSESRWFELSLIHCPLLCHGRGTGVGRGLGVGDGLNAGVAVGVAVGVGVGVGVGVTH